MKDEWGHSRGLRPAEYSRKIQLKDPKYPKIDDLDRWKLSRRRRVAETNPWRCTATKGKGYPGLSKEPGGGGGDTSRMAGKSRWERVSRIKVIEPAHLTEARITASRPSRHFVSTVSRHFRATHAAYKQRSLRLETVRPAQRSLPSVTRAHARFLGTRDLSDVRTGFHQTCSPSIVHIVG